MMRIEVLNPQHNRHLFDCGVEELNQYLINIARQHIEKGISKTFVLIDDSQPSYILGFMTLLLCEIKSKELPVKYAKKYPPVVPAAKLGRLAISKEKQRQGLGGLLLADAINRIISISKNFGIVGFFVDAKDNKAKQFYQNYGFIPFFDNSLSLFIPMKTLLSHSQLSVNTGILELETV